LLAQERFRVYVPDGMQQARQQRGLNQVEPAERMGISQGRGSRLESVHHDRRLASLVAHLHAVGAALFMAVKVGDRLIQLGALRVRTSFRRRLASGCWPPPRLSARGRAPWFDRARESPVGVESTSVRHRPGLTNATTTPSTGLLLGVGWLLGVP